MPYEVIPYEGNISRITLCEVEIVLNKKVLVLRPTLRGVLIAQKAGGIEKIINGIRYEEVDCIETGLKVGLNWSEKKNRKIGTKLYKNGVNDLDLIDNLIEFLTYLANGGKRPGDGNVTSEEGVKEEITLEEWADRLFLIGTGWLGWTPKVVLSTTLGALALAIEGKVDFVKKTNPFGSGEEENKMLDKPLSAELAAQKIQAFMKRKIFEQQGGGEKKAGRKD